MIDEKTGTYQFDEATLKKITGLDKAERSALLTWFAKQGEATQTEIMRLQTNKIRLQEKDALHVAEIREMRQRFPAECNLAHLIAAVSQLRWQERILSQKADQTDEGNGTILEAAGAILAHRCARIKSKVKIRSSPERDKFRKDFFLVVKTLREQKKLSWRQCADYMSRYHHQVWSHGWLRNEYQRIAQERILAGIDNTQIEPSGVEG